MLKQPNKSVNSAATCSGSSTKHYLTGSTSKVVSWRRPRLALVDVIDTFVSSSFSPWRKWGLLMNIGTPPTTYNKASFTLVYLSAYANSSVIRFSNKNLPKSSMTMTCSLQRAMTVLRALVRWANCLISSHQLLFQFRRTIQNNSAEPFCTWLNNRRAFFI